MKRNLLLLPAILLSGCWTFNETTYPDVATTAAAQAAKPVTLVGFETTLTEWEAVHGYRTVYVPGHYGYRRYHPGVIEVVPSVDYVTQHRATDMFVRRAQDQFEKAGFTVAPTGSAHTVEVSFEGPLDSSSDVAKKIAWNVLTAFFCDYDTTRWIAKLRIRDTKTGKLVFHHDYDQTYETNVFGLIPLFGAASSEKTDAMQMKLWCLSALTDRAVADATAFLK